MAGEILQNNLPFHKRNETFVGLTFLLVHYFQYRVSNRYNKGILPNTWFHSDGRSLKDIGFLINMQGFTPIESIVSRQGFITTHRVLYQYTWFHTDKHGFIPINMVSYRYIVSTRYTEFHTDKPGFIPIHSFNTLHKVSYRFTGFHTYTQGCIPLHRVSYQHRVFLPMHRVLYRYTGFHTNTEIHADTQGFIPIRRVSYQYTGFHTDTQGFIPIHRDSYR